MKITLVFLLLAVSASYGLPAKPIEGGPISKPVGGGPIAKPVGDGPIAKPVGGGPIAKPVGGGHVSKTSPSKIPVTNCFQSILKTDLQSVLSSVQKLFCSYENCKARENTVDQCSLVEWQVLLAELKVILKDTGCTVDWVLFQGKPTVETIAEEIGVILGQLRSAILELLSRLRFEEPTFNLLCDFLGDFLVKLPGHLDNLPNVIKIDVAPLRGLTRGL